MKLDKAFPSNYLKAADLDGKEPTVTIKAVKSENIGEDLKLVVYFDGKDKGLVLNKTNANSIADLTGKDDTDDWPGYRVKLITAKVEYQGKRVPAIRIEEPDPANGHGHAKPKPQSRYVTPHPPPPEPDVVPTDEDIPF